MRPGWQRSRRRCCARWPTPVSTNTAPTGIPADELQEQRPVPSSSVCAVGRARSMFRLTQARANKAGMATRGPETSSLGTRSHTAAPQRATAGNQALLRMLRSGAIQAKLSVSQPGDRLELEADHIAEKVMRMSEPSAATPTMHIQRMCSDCERAADRERYRESSDEPGLL